MAMAPAACHVQSSAVVQMTKNSATMHDARILYPGIIVWMEDSQTVRDEAHLFNTSGHTIKGLLLAGLTTPYHHRNFIHHPLIQCCVTTSS